MARNIVQGVGSAGINRDVKPQFLPSQVWSDGRNIRFEKDKCFGMGGVSKILASPVTNLLNVGIATSATTKFLLYTIGTKVYSYDGVTTTDITRTVGGNYSETIDDLFQIQMYNGLCLLNNSIDIPQQWGFTGALTALTNWNTNWTCGSLRPFKSLLIAMNMVETATLRPHRLRWSDPADPGAVPSSWDETDPTKEAGILDFADTEKGYIVDGLELGDRFYVYKQGSIWSMNYVGGTTTFARNNIANNVGLHVKRSLVEIPTSKQGLRYHFFASNNGFYVMDGQKVTPVFEDVFKRDIAKIIDTDNYLNRSFSVINQKNNEVWFCVPEDGEEYATKAYCMNYLNNTYTIRDLSGASNIVSGISYSSTAGTIIEPLLFSDGTSFSDTSGFSNTEITPSEVSIIEASPVLDNLYFVDTGVKNYDLTDYPVYVERVSLPTIKNDTRNPEAEVQDYSSRKMVSTVIPKLYGGKVKLQVGRQELENDSITWSSEFIVSNTKYKHDLNKPISGRFLSFRFLSYADEAFCLAGFDYELNVLGEF